MPTLYFKIPIEVINRPVYTTKGYFWRTGCILESAGAELLKSSKANGNRFVLILTLAPVPSAPFAYPYRALTEVQIPIAFGPHPRPRLKPLLLVYNTSINIVDLLPHSFVVCKLYNNKVGQFYEE